MSDLPPIERLRALRLEEGDTLIVSLPEELEVTADQAADWRILFKEALGDHPVIFSQGNVELFVIKGATA